VRDALITILIGATTRPPWRWRSPLDVALLEFRPEGEATCQPRATPWEQGLQGTASPERAAQTSTPAMSQSPTKDPILFGPFRARPSVVGVFPGRCPGLIYNCPFGAETQMRNIKTLAWALADIVPCPEVVDRLPDERRLAKRLS